MYKSSFRKCLFVILLISPCFAAAAGLGKLTINSALGQPLKAEIDLLAVKNEDIPSLSAQLGSQEAFKQAGVGYQSFFSTLKLLIEMRSNGDPYIKMTSLQAINEPFLNILVELSWASGRLMREYTVLLDPVEDQFPEPIAPTVKIESPDFREEDTAITSEPVDIQPNAPVAVTEPESLSQINNAKTYGPIRQGDTLSGIAQRIMPEGINLNQMLVALQRANQGAFIGNNMNLLKVGEMLRIPDENEIVSISESEANLAVKTQVAGWRSYQDGVLTAASDLIEQTDAGQMTATVETGDIVTEEVLRLSSGTYEEDTFGEESGQNVISQNRMRMMEEEAVARGLEIEEANERISMLEQSIQNLQKLLELKDPALAQAQLQAEIELVPENDQIAIVPTLSEIDSEFELTIATEEETEIQSRPTLTESVVTPEQPQPVEENSLTDQLMKNIEYIGGGLIALLLGILAFVKIRRKKLDNEAIFDDELSSSSNKTTALGVAGVSTAAAVAALRETDDPQLDENDRALDHDVDTLDNPVLEDDRDDYDDENASKETTNSEIDEADDASPFEFDDPTESSLQSSHEIDLGLGNSTSIETEHEIDLGLDDSAGIETEDDLDTGAVDPLAGLDLNIEDDVTESSDETETSILNEISDDLNVESTADNETSENPIEAEQPDADHSIEFDLDILSEAETESSSEVGTDELILPDENNGIDFTSEPDNTEPNKAEEGAASDDLDINLDQLELSIPDSDVETSQDAEDKAISTDDVPPLDLSLDDISLEMDDTTPPALDDVEPPTLLDEVTPPAMDDVPGEVMDNEHQLEVDTKIDLAKAYLEMEDNEGAKEILEEVISDDNASTAQQENAKEMLANL